MIESEVDARLVKICCMGLKVKQHLGHSISALYSSFNGLESKFGFNVCGEGGEYETCVFDCPLFKRAIQCETRMN